MYVIKAYWHNMSVYYINTSYTDKWNLNVRNLTEDISKATIYESIDDAEEGCRSINDSLFKVYPVCPKCNCDYEGHPAISRYDDKTLICSNCGVKEALEIFLQNKIEV